MSLEEHVKLSPSSFPQAMFAVPGWSVSASDLKTQTGPIPSPFTKAPTTQDGEAKPTVEKKSRKRKRENKAIDVTAENVGELWQTVTEGRPNSTNDTKKPDKANGNKEERKPNKRQRRQEAKAAREKQEEAVVGETHKARSPPDDVSKPPQNPIDIAAAAQDPIASPPLPTSNLTPLQSRMQSKLTSARFRHLNQTLYTTPSSSSLNLFTSTPDAYTAYHAGFRAQVSTWPENPVAGFIKDVEMRWRASRVGGRDVNGFRKKGKIAGGGGGGGKGEGEVRPLPSGRDGICRIVDLGCGDATLAASLRHLTAEATGAERKREKGKGHGSGGGVMDGGKGGVLEITSVDLAKGDGPNQGLITVGDVTDLKALGIRDGSIDVAVCCLSLMSTNWVGVVDECARVMRDGSEVWVAEIKSRFAKPRIARKGGIGKKKEKNGKKKKGDEEDEVEDEEMAALEEKKDAGETDVSAFVEVWRKRGFALAGDPEMGNKMFVKMRFVRASKAGEGQNGVTKGHSRFTAQDSLDSGAIDESKTLKPCVYKTR